MFYCNNLKKDKAITYTQIEAHKKTERVPVRMELPLKERLNELAEESNTTVSDLVRTCCLKELEKHRKVVGFTPVHDFDWELE